MIRFEACLHRTVYTRLRAIAKVRNVLVHFIDGNQPPEYKGEQGHWKRGNQTQTTMPKYPGWKYIRSTRRIEVGKDWVFERLTENEMKYFMERRLRHEQQM